MKGNNYPTFNNQRLNNLVQKITVRDIKLNELEKIEEEKDELVKQLRNNTFEASISYELLIKYQAFKVVEHWYDYSYITGTPRFDYEFIETEEKAKELMTKGMTDIDNFIGKEVEFSRFSLKKHKGIVTGKNIKLAYITKGKHEYNREDNIIFKEQNEGLMLTGHY